MWIAFRFCIFDLEPQLSSSQRPKPNCCELLSDFVSLTLSHNRLAINCYLQVCCELLSDFVSLTFSHNSSAFTEASNSVVNCFQILYLWPWATTLVSLDDEALGLWIAFRFCIFDLEPQHSAARVSWRLRCELLSDFVSLTLSHNFTNDTKNRMIVVNCFQILYLWPWATTERKEDRDGS